MPATSSRPATLVMAGVLVLSGLALAGGGGWLIALGGSWYYLIAGLTLILSGILLGRGQGAALWVYAALVLGTLVWALWEVGLDWWALAPRGSLIVVLGVLLLLPWVRRPVIPTAPAGRPALPLAGALLVALAVAVASWMTDPHRLEGRFADAGPGTAVGAEGEAGAGPVPPGEWHAYGRTSYGQRYSPLAQITPANVGQLEKVWEYNTGDIRGADWEPEETTFQVTPLKIRDRLYLCTPHQRVIALEADSGREVWTMNPEVRQGLALQHLTCRGLAYHLDPAAAVEAPCRERLFMPTADGRLIALSPETGERCPDFGTDGEIDLWQNMPNVRPGAYYSTSPPVVTRDLVIIGGTVLDNVSTSEASGVIRAFDVRSGAIVWAWDPARPDRTEPLPEGETYTPNSPNSWAISSVDEGLGLVYVPLGNQPPDQFGGDRSEAVEEYSSSVVALDVETGAPRWHFRTVNHDLWDYDVPSQPTLVDLTLNGEVVPALVQPTKQGDLYVLDRRTGEPILPVRQEPAPQGAVEGDFTAATQPASALSYAPPPLTESDMWGVTPFDQLACRIAFHRLRYEGRFTPPSLEGSLIHPGNFGVFNWGGVAVDPDRQLVFTTPAYLAFTSRLIPRADDTTLYVNPKEPEGELPALNENFGAPYAVELEPFTSVLGLPCEQPPWGYVSAADLTTGEIVWMHRNGTVRDQAPLPLPFEMGVPSLGGPLVTAGGVAFLSGTIDYYLRAYDVATGAELWKARLPAGGQATPMTFQGDDGRQYVVVAAGGHGSLGTKAGDSVIAYALPAPQ